MISPLHSLSRPQRQHRPRRHHCGGSCARRHDPDLEVVAAGHGTFAAGRQYVNFGYGMMVDVPVEPALGGSHRYLPSHNSSAGQARRKQHRDLAGRGWSKCLVAEDTLGLAQGRGHLERNLVVGACYVAQLVGLHVGEGLQCR